MLEVPIDRGAATEATTLAACVATILELPLEQVPVSPDDAEPATLPLGRWLAGLGLGLVPVADAPAFRWAGPWIGLGRLSGGERRAVVMYGVPSGVVWDPSGGAEAGGWQLEDGFLIAALDIALARPAPSPAPTSSGSVAGIYLGAEAGAPTRSVQSARALAGRGLEGDRHVSGKGSFPSGPAGSALTLIEAEVCESFDPALGPDEHRRNLLSRGIDLNALVGHRFSIGTVACRGVRLCEPCTVVDGYARRPVLRALVHRGGLRADILEDGVIGFGDPIAAT
jgi:MOSC domain-containing protein YiiM